MNARLSIVLCAAVWSACGGEDPDGTVGPPALDDTAEGGQDDDDTGAPDGPAPTSVQVEPAAIDLGALDPRCPSALQLTLTGSGEPVRVSSKADGQRGSMAPRSMAAGSTCTDVGAGPSGAPVSSSPASAAAQRLEAMTEQLEAVTSCMRAEQHARVAAEEKLAAAEAASAAMVTQLGALHRAQADSDATLANMQSLLSQLQKENTGLKSQNTMLAAELRQMRLYDR